MKLTERAYGKINLYLDLTGIRSDGYHEICTVMQTVSLADDLTLEITPDAEFTVSLDCGDIDLGAIQSNLIVRAANLVAAYKNVTGKHHFVLKKNIPVAAGMAGGSADAAAAIRLMNRAHNLSLSNDEMRKLAVKLGADIPFCIEGGTSLCEGIGEVITKLPPPEPFYLVISIGSDSVSTPAAFRALDAKYTHEDYVQNKSELSLCNFLNANGCAKTLFNRFEEVIIPLIPSVTDIKNILMENGALGAMMSGSGPSVFGIFDDHVIMQAAANALRESGFRAHVCQTANGNF